MDVGKQR